MAVLLVAGIWIFKIISEYQRADQEYEVLTEYIRETDEGDTAQDDKTENKEVEETEGSGSAEDYTVDFDTLKQINSDIVAWIRIPGVLDYSVVQGTDNSYYLHHTFRREYNIAGSVFLDARNKADFSDSKNIIYGHNMRDGSMFHVLRNFQDLDFYQANREIWLYLPDGSVQCFLASNFPHFHRYDSLKSALYIHAVSKNINTFPKNQGRIRAAIAVKILDFTVMYR